MIWTILARFNLLFLYSNNSILELEVPVTLPCDIPSKLCLNLLKPPSFILFILITITLTNSLRYLSITTISHVRRTGDICQHST